jgi:hypothetical protein
MADWKQITARIKRARTGKDPAGQLSNLFEKTRDAMVAFELARHFETAGQGADAAKWYATAAERFRRADWKTKAEEAVTRLGGSLPQENAATNTPDRPSDDFVVIPPPITMPEPTIPFVQTANTFETIMMSPHKASPQEETSPRTDSLPDTQTHVPDDKKRRRRGRRGGRNRRKSSPEAAAASHTARHSAPATPQRAGSPEGLEAPPESRLAMATETLPPLPIDPAAEAMGPAVRGRYGDPGLSSRLSLLEMQFRRLLTCAPVKLDEADRAPVGPGVFLLTDSDLTSYYYVEACQTLRIAIANLLRGGASRRGVDSIKPQLAEHLGIAESRVPKYLAEHCVVRWLQLDDDASHFAHFVIAVLRPTLNQ